MKVGTKLTVGFLVIVLLVWLTVFHVESTFTSIQKQSDLLKEDIVPGAIAMSEMIEKAEEIKSWSFVYILKGNAIKMDKPVKEWLQESTSSLEKLAREHAEHETHIGLAEQKAAEELKDRVKQVSAAVAEIINLKDRGMELDELVKKREEAFAPVFQPLITQLEEHKAAHMEELAESEDVVQRMYTSSKQVLFITASLVTLLAAVVVFFVTRSIVKPLHALHRGTEIIGQGNLDYKVGTDAKDEIGQLSRAFDQMTGNLRKTTTSIDNLNKEITERNLLEESIHRRNAELAALYSVAITTSQSSDLDDILNNTLDRVLEVLEIEAGGILLVNEETEELELAVHRGISEELAERVMGIKVGEGLSGRVAQSSEPLIVDDISSEPGERQV